MDRRVLSSKPASITTRCFASGSAHVRRAASDQSPSRRRPAQARACRHPGAELAARSRQRRGQRDDGDGFRHARSAVAARAGGGGARLQPLPADVPPRHRSRCGAVADRRREDRRRRRPEGHPESGEPGAAFRASHFRRRMDRPVADEGNPPRHRRAARPCARRRNLHARVPVGPCAEPPVLRRALGLRRARAAASDAGRGTRRCRLQRLRQLCADLRQVRHARARDHRLGSRHHPVADADVRAARRLLAWSTRACAA